MKRSKVIILHIIFWMVMLALLFPIAFFILSRELHYMFNPLLVPEVWILTLVPLVYLLFPFYFSYTYFTNQMVKSGSKKTIWLFLILFILYYTALLRVPLILSFEKPRVVWLSYFSLSIILTAIFGSLGSLFNIIEKWYANEKITIELKKKNLRMEFDLLKSRMNPHFLFNTINNIDVLIEENPKRASNYLQKLSDILRFVLYKADTTAILLNDEIENINDFLELQKLRTLNKEFIRFDVTGDTNNQLIAPLLFIPFIENAFKYAPNKKIKYAVNISLDVSKNHITFTCKNHFDVNNKTVENYDGGLGNKLMQQRLDLLYKNKYELKIKQEENWYSVMLKIELNDH